MLQERISEDPRQTISRTKGVQLVQISKNENIIETTLHKLREATTVSVSSLKTKATLRASVSLGHCLSSVNFFFCLQDVWQGTQLLATDSAAAVELLRRSLIGDELTEKEKKALRRTMTDLASVIPIGILMLLPVSQNILLHRQHFFLSVLIVSSNKTVELTSAVITFLISIFFCTGPM